MTIEEIKPGIKVRLIKRASNWYNYWEIGHVYNLYDIDVTGEFGYFYVFNTPEAADPTPFGWDFLNYFELADEEELTEHYAWNFIK